MKQTSHQLLFLLLSLVFFNQLHSQVTLSFQGAETGDPWSYTTSGASALAMSEALSAQNKTSGTQSLVAGGNTGGGNCFASGTGNGPSTARYFAFSTLDISQSNESTRTLTFNWGNRFPACNGTGWDSGENLTFTAYHDGVAQPTVTLATGSGNAQFSIQTHQHSHSIPPCVNSFRFTVSVTTNRADELLFIDDVILTAPQLNSSTAQPDPISGLTSVCQNAIENYSVTGVPSTVYTWSGLPAGAQFTSPNGTTGSNTITVDWGSAAPAIYTLTVTPSNACGASGTPQTIDVTVIGQPSVSISPSGQETICNGSSILITPSGSSGTYTWQDNSNGTTFLASTAGEYYVSVSNSCGSADSDTLTVTVIDVPTLTITGSNSFCPGDSVLLTANGGTNYTWSNGATGTAIYVTSPGTYTVSSSNSCGSSDSPGFAVTVGTSPVAQISGNNFFCTGDSVLLTASGGDTYLWSNGHVGSTLYVSAPGNYSVVASNGCGDSAPASVTINEFSIPTPAINGTLSYCAGDSTLLTASGATNYVWSTGTVGNSIYATSPGNYSVIGSNQCGASAPVTVTVAELSAPVGSINGTGHICEGEVGFLSTSGGDSYLWSTGETTETINITTGGTYSVTITNTCGSATVSINVTSSFVEAAFSYVLGTGLPASAEFTNETSVGATSYSWDFGNGDQSVLEHPSTSYETSGNYLVTLTANDAFGCESTYSEWIFVENLLSNLEVPNVFTPNNDFVNDLFLVNASNIRDFNMHIFNRWGEEILTIVDVQQGWDGKINGELAHDGTYYYKIDATGFDAQNYQLSGFFQLVR